MIQGILLFLFAAQASTTLAAAAAGTQGAPQIRCEISVASWCIATFDGAISMKDGGDDRIWTLLARGAPSDQPMIIVENKSCSDYANEEQKVIERGKEISFRGLRYQSFIYKLNSNGCRLEFKLPLGDVGAQYKQVMLYGILIGYNKQGQLYTIVNRSN